MIIDGYGIQSIKLKLSYNTHIIVDSFLTLLVYGACHFSNARPLQVLLSDSTTHVHHPI